MTSCLIYVFVSSKHLLTFTEEVLEVRKYFLYFFNLG